MRARREYIALSVHVRSALRVRFSRRARAAPTALPPTGELTKCIPLLSLRRALTAPRAIQPGSSFALRRWNVRVGAPRAVPGLKFRHGDAPAAASAAPTPPLPQKF